VRRHQPRRPAAIQEQLYSSSDTTAAAEWGRTGKSRSAYQQEAMAASLEAGGDTKTPKEDSFAVDAHVPRSRRHALPSQTIHLM